MITIRFVGGDDAVSKLIRAGSYGYWATHTEALMPEGSLLGAHLDGGVMARPRDYDAGEFKREEYVELAAKPNAEDAFNSFLHAQLGKAYDMKVIEAIAASALLGERNWRDPGKWICSELIAAALEAAGWLPRLATDVNHLTPRDVRLLLSARGY